MTADIAINDRVEIPAFWTSQPRRKIPGKYVGRHHTGHPLVELDAGGTVVLFGWSQMKKIATKEKEDHHEKDHCQG